MPGAQRDRETRGCASRLLRSDTARRPRRPAPTRNRRDGAPSDPVLSDIISITRIRIRHQHPIRDASSCVLSPDNVLLALIAQPPRGSVRDVGREGRTWSMRTLPCVRRTHRGPVALGVASARTRTVASASERHPRPAHILTRYERIVGQPSRPGALKHHRGVLGHMRQARGSAHGRSSRFGVVT